jgi:flavin-dependent dehydrogenase
MTYDVAVIGGGPGGSTTAGFLARAGLRVALFEREAFPRLRVGESLLPAMLPVLERLGARATVETHGFLIKHGATFYDQESGHTQTFYFLEGKPWPPYAYQVQRGEFDALLLDHARGLGVDVHQPAAVESVAFDRDGVTVRHGGPEMAPTFGAKGATPHSNSPGPDARSAPAEPGRSSITRARFLVDASGRESFLASRTGRRERIPNLGKVALFAHYRGAARAAGREEGNIGIHVFDDGWFWWIPFSGDITSVGCVMHARTVRGRERSLEALYEDMIRRCPGVATRLAGAERITDIHPVANFSYVNRPVVGDRFLCVGDTIAFVDPIFSGGVFIAMRSGELAAEAIARAFREDRFEAARFRAYERAVFSGITPLFKMIHKYYEPAFFELFLRPSNRLGIADAMLSMLAGGFFQKMPWRSRASLALLFSMARVNVWVRRWAGRPVGSRLEW